MATSSQAQAVKSLNEGPGRRKFVFKNFSQRLEDIDINVYRSLDKVKSEPSEGSSFFRDCLIEWRELNTAEDFISFYDEMMPFVQTLPLILLHREEIFSKLHSRLQMKARLSVEAILRLLASLSRDLLADYIPFLPRLVDSFEHLLKSGGEREAEIIEQIFISWSSIMMYLQKYLTQDVVFVLKVTQKLRYYPKSYVQEFMAEATSFLLRNASDEQLSKGIRKVMLEVVKKPLTRISGASALLYYVLRGTSSSLHSRAERVLKLLVNKSIYAIGDTSEQGSDSLIEVVDTAFIRLCEVLEPQELSLMWRCLYQEINHCTTDNCLMHLSRILSLLISLVKIENECTVTECQQVLEQVGLLVQKFIVPSASVEEENHLPKVVDKVLQLMLGILDLLHRVDDVSTISSCSMQWAPVFQLQNSSLLTFTRDLLQKDQLIIQAFSANILRAMNDLIESSQEEVIFMLLSLCEKLQIDPQSCSILNGVSKEILPKVYVILKAGVRHWTGAVRDIFSSQIDVASLAVLWGMITCYPLILDDQETSPLLLDFMEALDEMLKIDAEQIAGVHRPIWESLLGASLRSYHKWNNAKQRGHGETTRFLNFAKAYKSSSQVLSAVADYMDYEHGPALQGDNSNKVYHPELVAEKAGDVFSVFSENLCQSDKVIRVTSLRILCQFEPLSCDAVIDDQPPHKKLKSEESQTSLGANNVLHLLLSIEETPLLISTSRKVVLLISKIQMDISAGRIPKIYVPLVFNGVIGIFHNRFSSLWDQASECLSILISKHTGLIWDEFVHFFEKCQASFQTFNDKSNNNKANVPGKSTDLTERFNTYLNPTPSSDSTPSSTVLSMLLKSLQKVHFVAESRSRQVIPLFLKFLGYSGDDHVSVGLFNSCACKGKEWKGILKEWLNLLKLMKNPKGFYLSQFVKDVMQNRLLDDNDAEVQMSALECLLVWKDDFLLPYDLHLRNLICSKKLREELTTWSLSRESGQVEDVHRVHLMPLVVRLLMPKVRKLKTLASRKNASVFHRKAVLGFIAQLDADELPLFFALLIKPLNIASGGVVDLFWATPSSIMADFQASNFLKYFTVENISGLSWKKRYGFLHVIQHILEVFDEFHVGPFLDVLMGCVVRMLLSCTSNLEAAKGANSSVLENHCNATTSEHEEENATGSDVLTAVAVKQLKELRALCLKIVSAVLEKYEGHDFGSEFWELFFASVKPLIESFKHEGSSSEKPSSLFSCFLVMSRSHNLVSLLSREKNLVPDIFSILAVKTATQAIISGVLNFIENMLNLDGESDGEDTAVKTIMLPNLEILISSLHSLFLGDSDSKRNIVRSPGEKEVKIFKLLAKYIQDPLHARKFVEILLPFLAKRVKDTDICLMALQIVQDVVSLLGIEITTKILNVVSPLLITAELDMRLCICDLFASIAKTDSSVLVVAKLIHDLNATSPMEMGGLDYDMIVNTYERIAVDFFFEVRDEHALVILSHCMYDISSEELILRQSAYRLLLSFIEFSALILGEEKINQNDRCEEMIVERGNWTGACIQRVINNFILKHIGNALSQGSSVKKEWVLLLREIVLKVPDVGNLSSFKDLCSENAEVDFFNNILHLQKHRRARALLRFKAMLSNSNAPEGILKNVFIPFFFNMLLDIQDGKDEHIKAACMEALASISAKMEWKSYYALLNRCFRAMNLKINKQKVLMRLVCSVLDQFHFVKNGSNEEAVDAALGADTLSEIRTCLQKVVIPKIRKLMNSESDNVNVNISLAALKLLKLLPGDVMDSQLPTIIHRVCNFLKNRLESVRDEARLALAACLKELGIEYLQFIVKVLRSTLKRGYEMHVLGYTLNFLLSKSLLKPICGKLDYCLEDLLFVVENDILGEVAEQKEVEKIASKMKETRKCKSFESLKLISQSVTFKSHALKLLSPVAAHLRKHLTPKVKSKVESMLDQIAAGIECNPSVDQTDLFIFVYGLIKDGIGKENVVAGDGLTADTNMDRGKRVRGKTVSTGRVIVANLAGSHFITVFALRLMHNRTKNIKLDKNDEQLLSMLDPFVKLLGDCLSSKYEDVLSSSLRCLTPLVRLPLPSLESHADKIKSTLLDVAQNTVNSSNLLMQSCIRLLTVLLRSTKVTLSSDHLRLLIQFPMFVDLERDPSLVALALLKAIVKRKLVVREIYDVVDRVQELMVTSQVESIRKKCSQILLQFLLDYQLSGDELQKRLNFLVKNLSYEHSSGREALLEMLHAIIIKFPKSIMDEQSRTLFLNLVLRLVNDHDNKVRSMTGAVIKLLIGRISQHSQRFIIDYSLSLYLGKEQRLWSAAAQVLGLLVEVMGKGFRKHVNIVLPAVRNILHSAISADACQQHDSSDEASLTLWKEAYYSLVMLEKILLQFPDLRLQKDLEETWEAICELLLHPHMWLRNISSRLLAIYFATVTEACKGNTENSIGSFFLMKPSRLFMVAVSLCCQLKSLQIYDDAVSKLLTQNLAFAFSVLHSLMGVNPREYWATLEQHDQGRFLKAFQRLDSRKGRGIFMNLVSGVEHKVDEQTEDIQNMLVSILLKRMGKIALEMGAIQMGIVFSSFREFSSQISQDDCRNYAIQMLPPLYKVCEGFAGKVISDDMKQLGQDVFESLKVKLGIQTFMQIYNEIKKKQTAKRQKRRQEEKVMAVVNPMRNAKRKLRIAEKHRVNKKRKMMTMKMARWMRS